ncbi:peptidase S8 and S53, subtilisin, kexin, sedolisin [Mycobacteroides abscessus subsp. massiliense]|uniref:type VII secretion-associated serine protease mycosin n=1 Tax=Mycobacteroides abscessus TaxID=36809 RepID=UPI0009A7AC9F|nr:type VII secretion-associated serine protease mycosin [Mycobacteroides abscessus]SLE99334.1 peptidase S8 and S53, subtilisin, kexin, sedolisin [Mycobacteroides abscessus subsp. massiliense]
MSNGKTVHRVLVAAMVALLAVTSPVLGPMPVAHAIKPPVIPGDPTPPPDPDVNPPEMRLDNRGCVAPGIIPDPPIADAPPASVMMNLAEAHKFSRGSGVKVAVIDTGVTPSPRFAHLTAGADWVEKSAGGLADCDSHGTLIASIIGASAAPGDQFVGVAPEAEIISYRQSSTRYTEAQPTFRSADPAADARANHIGTVAAAIVKAANAGARVINISVIACIPANQPIDQTALALAVRYATVEKGALIVAAAGNVGGGAAAAGETEGCQQNPLYDPGFPNDPRNWDHVTTVSSPGWFYDYVVAVGAVDRKGAPQDREGVAAAQDQGAPQDPIAAQFSMRGPWVDLAGPGTNIIAIGPDGSTVNALPNRSNVLGPIEGTSFSAAWVSGVAALLFSLHPDWTPAQVRRRLTDTAHGPARGIANDGGGLDNAVGHGLVDPVAALTSPVPPGDGATAEPHRVAIALQPEPQPRNHAPQIAAGAIGTGVIILLLVAASIRRRNPDQEQVNA